MAALNISGDDQVRITVPTVRCILTGHVDRLLFCSPVSTLSTTTTTNTPVMSSRINIARPSAATYSGDPHGLSNSRPSSTGYRAANPDDPLEKIRAVSRAIEDNVEIYTQPLKPHLPAIGRFLIVVTFLEDALRILTQWSDQIWYLQRYVALLQAAGTHSESLTICRHRSFPWGVSHFFLLINVIVGICNNVHRTCYLCMNIR